MVIQRYHCQFVTISTPVKIVDSFLSRAQPRNIDLNLYIFGQESHTTVLTL